MSERVPAAVPGNVLSVLSSSVTHLDPQEAVWRAMVRGWELQQGGRLLNPTTIAGRLKVVNRFMTFTGEYPWRWQPVDVEEWTASLRAGGARAHSTLRSYQNSPETAPANMSTPTPSPGDSASTASNRAPTGTPPCSTWSPSRPLPSSLTCSDCTPTPPRNGVPRPEPAGAPTPHDGRLPAPADVPRPIALPSRRSFQASDGQETASIDLSSRIRAEGDIIQ